ncbi:MAG TPA: hypothetical protein VK528_12655, partial [Flavobacterium sp.]|nr:hypothetical protein [Flavobacterium sp.]
MKTAFLDLIRESKSNPALLFIILTLLSIPLGHVCSSIALISLAAISLLTFKKSNFRFETALLLPMALFALMALSLLWTNDFDASIKALQKGLPLLGVPLCFMVFPKLDADRKQKVLRYFSVGMVLFTLFWLLKAAFRFAVSGDSNVLFYHELVTEDVNAIHVSVYIAIAFFYFLTKAAGNVFDKFAMVLLPVFLILLSSKNIIIVFFILVLFFVLKYNKMAVRGKFIRWGLLFF